MLKTPRAVASLLLLGRCLSSNLSISSIVLRGTDPPIIWELIVKARASIVVSRCVLRLGARMVVALISPGPGDAHDPNVERLTQLRM